MPLRTTPDETAALAHRLRVAARSARACLARVLLATGLLAALSAPAARAFDVVCPEDWELRVVELINAERLAADLADPSVTIAPLAIDVRLVASAERHSQDLSDGEFLSHTGSDGSTPTQRMSAAGYPSPGGETAGAGHWTPEMIVDGWMNSSGHRAILLSPAYTHVGVGYVAKPNAANAMYRHVWTANFGRSAEPPYAPGEFCGPAPACSNGVDDDGDGLADFGEDPGCAAPQDDTERADCSDGVDNDGDGLVDFPADGFCRDATWPTEAAACSDGWDNDGDGLVDFPADPQCESPDQPGERMPACGLGFEVALLLPLLVAARARRRRRAAAA